MTLKECTDIQLRGEARLDIAQKSKAEKEAELAKRALLSSTIEETQTFLQQVARDTQEQIRFHLEDIVNLALDTVFPGRYQFRIFFEIKRDRTEARISLLRGEREVDPMYSNGGGIKDILAFALRIALLLISKNRKLLLLDEPFKYISEDLKEAAFGIMKRLSAELGIQIIAVTHDEQMVEIADKVIKVRIEKGVSYVEQA